MTPPFMKLFLWEETKGTDISFSPHPTPIIVTEGLGVKVEDRKCLEATEVMEKAQKEKTRDYEQYQKKEERSGSKSIHGHQEAMGVSRFPIPPWDSPNCLASMLF